MLGAAGGTGSAAIQLGSTLGAHVIAVVGGEEKAEYCRGLGADDTIDHRTEDVAARLRELTGGRGVDLVYDPVGRITGTRGDRRHRERGQAPRRGLRERRDDAPELP